MRPLLLFLFAAGAASAQLLSFGVKGGVPITDHLDTSQGPNFNFSTVTHRYIIGPTAELKLPLGFSLEVDALYRRLNYDGRSFSVDVVTNSTTTGNAWEFPLLAKYRFPSRIVRPYVDAGVAWDTLSGLGQTTTNLVISGANLVTSHTSSPAELHKSTTAGFVVGAGLDVHALILHIAPEIRYTRWGAQHFLSSNGGLQSNQNQAEFLVGITF